jgi:hypothetical protein
MLKVRWWIAFTLLALGVAAGATSAQAATLVEHNVQPFDLTPNTGSPPEFGRCLKSAGGEFEDAGCTKAAGGPTGGYEWHPAFGGGAPLERTKFTTAIKAGTVSILETVGKSQMVCDGAGSSGEYTGSKSVGGVTVTFTSCTAFEGSCTSAGEPTGTVVTHTLEGTLGVEELGAAPIENTIAEDLFPPGRAGPVAEFSCSGIAVTITGSLIAPVPSNAMKLTVPIKFKAVRGRQRQESFAGEPPDVLFTSVLGAVEQSGEAMTVNQSNEEKVEVNSVV